MIEDSSETLITMTWKEAQQAPSSKADIINLIIQQGMGEAMHTIEKLRTTYADSILFDENTLNWLGYHFLFWWGRENEAIEVFQLNVALFPKSANTYDSLGEAFLINGNQEKAIENYEKSLELNPDNQNARSVLEQLKTK